MQMVRVAFQSDVSPGESGEFLLQYTEIPKDSKNCLQLVLNISQPIT